MRLVNRVLAGTLVLLFSAGAIAEGGSNAQNVFEKAISDGKLTPEEMGRFAGLGVAQLQTLIKEGMTRVTDDLEDDGIVKPSGMLMMNDGTTKALKLGPKAAMAPPRIALAMYRKALLSLARHKTILGGALLYSAKDKDGTLALVIEYEHRLGLAGTRLLPYEVDGDTMKYGELIDKEKPFQWFYDEKSKKGGQAGQQKQGNNE